MNQVSKNVIEFFCIGLKVVYDLKKPIGERVQDAQVLCSECSIPQYEPLNTNQMYSVIISEFLKNGGDKFEVLRTEIVNETKTGILNFSRIQLAMIQNYCKFI